MRRFFVPATVGVLLVAAGIAANNPNNPKQDHNDAFVPGPDNESQLAKQVRHNLMTLPYYSIFDDLAFQVNGSVVTLQGACPPDPPWDIKKDAENAVKKVPGVTQVINNIR